MDGLLVATKCAAVSFYAYDTMADYLAENRQLRDEEDRDLEEERREELATWGFAWDEQGWDYD